MQLGDAYAVLNLPPGTPEAQVRYTAQQAQMHWSPERNNQNPQAAQYAAERRAACAMALDVIARAGFPLPMPAVGAPQPIDQQRADKRSQGVKRILGGIGLIVLGAVITAVTHDAAVRSGGGTYVVAYGPMVVGVVMFFQGLFGVVTA